MEKNYRDLEERSRLLAINVFLLIIVRRDRHFAHQQLHETWRCRNEWWVLQRCIAVLRWSKFVACIVQSGPGM